jgi:hypothetical protein
MPLTEFVTIAAPRHVAQICTVVADDVDISSFTSLGSDLLPGRTAFIAMVFLDQNVVTLLSVEGTAVLGVYITPGLSLHDQIEACLFKIENKQSPRGVFSFSVPEEPGESQTLTVGRDRR